MEMTKELMHDIQRINEQTGFNDTLKSFFEQSIENTSKFEDGEKTSKDGEPTALKNVIEQIYGKK